MWECQEERRGVCGEERCKIWIYLSGEREEGLRERFMDAVKETTHVQHVSLERKLESRD